MTDPRWTAETEELVHRTLHDLDVRINNLTGDHHCNLVSQVVLTALADAGLLLPPGGETRQDVGRAIAAEIRATMLAGVAIPEDLRPPRGARPPTSMYGEWAARIAEGATP